MKNFKKSQNLLKLRKILKDINTRMANKEDVDAMFTTIKNVCKDGYWEWRFKENYRYFSPSLKEQLGYGLSKDDEEFYLKLKDMLKDGDDVLIIEALEEHINSKGKKPFRVILNYTKKNGELIKILCRGVVTDWDENGGPVRMVGSHIDITDI